jgi:hypothetical protein
MKIILILFSAVIVAFVGAKILCAAVTLLQRSRSQKSQPLKTVNSEAEAAAPDWKKFEIPTYLRKGEKIIW